jgi:Fe-Mn family superoxide dismutase
MQSKPDRLPSGQPHGFTLPELPYPLNALEPHMSARTLEVHHGKHHKAYVVKANQLAKGTPVEGLPLEQAVVESHRLGVGPLFNNIAQIFNHNLFWQSMTPDGARAPSSGPLFERLSSSFGGIDGFKQQFVKAGLAQFGSGWVWLVATRGKLEIVATGNAATPLTEGKNVLLVCDVWEHAYYLDVQNRREEFLQRFVDRLVNWSFAERQLAGRSGVQQATPLRATLDHVN